MVRDVVAFLRRTHDAEIATAAGDAESLEDRDRAAIFLAAKLVDSESGALAAPAVIVHGRSGGSGASSPSSGGSDWEAVEDQPLDSQSASLPLTPSAAEDAHVPMTAENKAYVALHPHGRRVPGTLAFAPRPKDDTLTLGAATMVSSSASLQKTRPTLSPSLPTRPLPAGLGSASDALTAFALAHLEAGHLAAATRPFFAPHLSGGGSSERCGGASDASLSALRTTPLLPLVVPAGLYVAWRAPVRQRLVFAFTTLEDALSLGSIPSTTGAAAAMPSERPQENEEDAHGGIAAVAVISVPSPLPAAEAASVVRVLAVAEASGCIPAALAAATALHDEGAVRRLLLLAVEAGKSEGKYKACVGGGLVHASDYSAAAEVLAAELEGDRWAAALAWAGAVVRGLL